MKNITAILILCLISGTATCQESGADAKTMKAMMEKGLKLTEPGENHKYLEKLIGQWATETSFVMGGKKGMPTAGKCKVHWLMPGRWLKSEVTGTMMGRPVSAFTLIGYVNFKKSFNDDTIVFEVHDLHIGEDTRWSSSKK